MEGAVKLKQAYLPCAMALALVAGLMGCKDDSAAVSALQELTTELSMEVEDQNKTLTNLTAEIETCMKSLAETKGEAVVITSKSVEADVPSLRSAARAMMASPSLGPGPMAPVVPTRMTVCTPAERSSSMPMAICGPPIPVDDTVIAIPSTVPV